MDISIDKKCDFDDSDRSGVDYDVHNNNSSSSAYEDCEEEVGCLLCLDPMKPTDLAHPLMCPRRCGFNFCVTCIESLLHSSEDDFMEASDGNRHVKVYLRCPNCRSDLGPTIRDTILLRKVDALPLHDDVHHACGGKDHRHKHQVQHHPQQELTSKQLQWKKAMDTDVMLLKEIADARSREAKFFDGSLYHHHNNLHDDETGSSTKSSSSTEDNQFDVEYNADDYADDEWGFEVDDALGAHETIKLPREMWANTHDNTLRIDTTLLAGLEETMTVEDQEFLTKYMTSGDPTKLAAAAQFMASIADIVYEGKTTNRPNLVQSKRPSVYALIEESQKARLPLDKKAINKKYATTTTRTPFRRRSSSKIKHHLELERKLRQAQAYMRLHPLPVRMPKYMEIVLEDSASSPSKFPFTFCNDIWDGSVMDAFSKIYIGPLGRISKKRQENVGVRNVLDGGTRTANCGDVRIDTERTRILVSRVGPEARRKGIMKGDVLTHVNNMEVSGKNVTDLQNLIQECRNKHDGKLYLVFNAERSVAEALRLRSIVKDNK